MPTIYYAHPMSWFGTPDEAKDLDYIKQRFSEYTVVNPAEFKEGNGGMDLMDYCLSRVRASDALIFRGFVSSGGLVGSGVAREILEAMVNGLPVWRLNSYLGRPNGRGKDPVVEQRSIERYGSRNLPLFLNRVETHDKISKGEL